MSSHSSASGGAVDEHPLTETLCGLAESDVVIVRNPFYGPCVARRNLTRPPYKRWPPPPGVHLEPPYERQLGQPGYEVCPNCGFEFGNDDNPGTAAPVSFAEYRAQ